MNKRIIIATICLAITTAIVFTIDATELPERLCSSKKSIPGISTEPGVSTEFTSKQDVIDFCSGKTFKVPYVGVTTTGNSSNIVVKSFSGSNAVICVYFDMSEVLGRAVQSGVDFEINKVTGEYWQKKDPADENNPFR